MKLDKVFDTVIYMDTFFKNFKGLMFKKTIGSSECYILETTGIHTLFMRFPIDVIYLNMDKKVIKKIKKMKPYRVATINSKCKYVLEFRNNDFINQVSIGDVLEF